MTACKFKVGDVVEVVDEDGGCSYTNGDVCKVTRVENVSNNFTLVYTEGHDAGMCDFRFKLHEPKPFSLKDIIKPWMRVQTRGGGMYLAVEHGGVVVLADSTGFNLVQDKYSISKYDIIAVYNPPYNSAVSLLDTTKLGPLVWKLQTEKEKRIEALEKELAELKGE